MASEAVGIIFKAEADDVAGATPEPVWGVATLRTTHHKQFVDDSNDQVLLWAPQGYPQGLQQCCPSAVGTAALFLFCKVDSRNVFDSTSGVKHEG